MPRDTQLLLDMLVSAKLAMSYVADQSQADFVADMQLQDAVIRRLSIIGEAARRISEEVRQTYPTIPWNEIGGMRNRLIHEYDDLDLDIIWATLQTSLPLLIEELQKIVL